MDRGLVMNRRDFLKKLGIGSVVAVVAPSALLSEDEDDGHWVEGTPALKWTPDNNTGFYIDRSGDLQFTNVVIRGRTERRS